MSHERGRGRAYPLLPLTAEPNDVRRLFGLKLETGEGGLLDSLSALDGEGADWASKASSMVRLADAGIREARASDRRGQAIGAAKQSAQRWIDWLSSRRRRQCGAKVRARRAAKSGRRFAMHA